MNNADIAAICGGAVVAAIGLFGAWKVASRPPEPQDARELARVSRQVASLARETALAANAILHSRVTLAYATTHREKLEEAVGEEAGKLEASFAPALRHDAEEARELTARLAETLKSFKRHLAEPEGLQEVADDAESISVAVARLEPPT